MPVFWIPWFSFQPNPSFTLNHNVLFFEIPWSRDTRSPDTLLGQVCGSFRFIPLSSVVLPSFFCCLHSSIPFVHPFCWSFPVKSMAFLLSCLLYQWKNWHTFLDIVPMHFHFHILLHQVVFLGYIYMYIYFPCTSVLPDFLCVNMFIYIYICMLVRVYQYPLWTATKNSQNTSE